MSNDSSAGRIRAIEDRQAIEQLILGDYPRALDKNDWPAYAALFAADGELVLGPTVVKGRDAIAKFLSAPDTFTQPLQPGAAPRRRLGPGEVLHLYGNPSIKISGDSAVAGTYWYEIGLLDGRPQLMPMAGRCDIQVRKIDGAWKLARFEIIRDMPPLPRQ